MIINSLAAIKYARAYAKSNSRNSTNTIHVSTTITTQCIYVRTYYIHAYIQYILYIHTVHTYIYRYIHVIVVSCLGVPQQP